MKRIIFSTFDDIQQDDSSIATHSEHMHAEYFDRLVENKKDYAESIGVEFKLYHNTMNDFELNDELEFTKANLYKHHIMATLAEDYDEVMYVDMDVLFNTNENVFDSLDLSKGIHVKDQDSYIKSKTIEDVVFKKSGLRSPTIKYHITKDLLGGKDNHVMNTGIMIGKSEHIKMICFIERMPLIIKRIHEIKHFKAEGANPVYLRMCYYGNNEAIFSYIMEEYNIPYVLMSEDWHDIVDHIPRHLNKESKVYHFINKRFNAFFKDKTQLVFSIYIDIPESNLDQPHNFADDKVNKSMRTKQRLAVYSDSLLQNHKDYAKAVNAEYMFFERDEEYERFYDRFPLLSEYDVINLYKVYLLDKLVKEFDYVMYIDFDVYFNQHINIFDYVPVDSSFCCNNSDVFDIGVFPNAKSYFESYKRDFRNPSSKYWNSHALLQEEDLNTEDLVVFNTGIMLANQKTMKRIDYFSDIEEVIETMSELKEFSMYPEGIQKAFGFDNETIMGYKIIKNNVPYSDLDSSWHHKHDYSGRSSFDTQSLEHTLAKNKYEIDLKTKNVIITHFISKNFGLVFDK